MTHDPNADAESWPDHSSELARKLTTVLEQRLVEHADGNLSDAQLSATAASLHEATSGLVPKDVSELVCEVRDSVPRAFNPVEECLVPCELIDAMDLYVRTYVAARKAGTKDSVANNLAARDALLKARVAWKRPKPVAQKGA